MKKRILGILLVLCMVLSFVPTTVLAAETPYVAVGDSYFKAGESKSVKVGGGTATFDPATSKLTLNNINLSYGNAKMAAIQRDVSLMYLVIFRALLTASVFFHSLKALLMKTLL